MRGKIADLDPTFRVKRKSRSRAPNAPEKARKRAWPQRAANREEPAV